MARRVGVVGWEISEQAPAIEDSRTNLVYRTVRALLDKTGVKREEISTVVMCSNDFYDGHTISNVFTVEAAAAYLKDEVKVEQDGLHAMIYAVMRIAAGTHEVALVVAHSKGSEFEPSVALAAQLEPCVDRQYLFLNDVAIAAFQARAVMNSRKLGEELLARVAVKNLNNAARNPWVKVRKSGVSVEQVMGSRMLFDPLREMMTYPVTDGCCAMLLAAEDKVKKYPERPVWVEGMGMNQEAYHLSERDLDRSRSCQAAARQAYKMAGITDPSREIQVAEISEMFAHQEILFTEALGLCPEGEGGKMLVSGRSAFQGELPVNPSGGALSACALCAVGLIRAAEVAGQLRGQAGARQVDSPRRGAAHGQCGPAAQNNAVVVLAAG